MVSQPKIAYFSMEVGLDPRFNTYSGGLGVLAGDTLHACADLKVPVVGITLLNEKGYFHQKLSDEGDQLEQPAPWNHSDFLEKLPIQLSICIEGREVYFTAWKWVITGTTGYSVPVYFLDTNLEANKPEDREYAFHLYGGNYRYRLIQEVLLGIGGIRLLSELGMTEIEKYHLNEGHAALLILELIAQKRKEGEEESQCRQFLKERTVFTTHTPLPVGHDIFQMDITNQILDKEFSEEEISKVCFDGELNMTRLAIEYSGYVNGVSKKHGEVSRKMFPGFEIDAITNGIQANFWASEPMKELFDQFIPEWRQDASVLKKAEAISLGKIEQAHQKSKKELIEFVNQQSEEEFKEEVFTIGFARRAATYKRASLLFKDLERLKSIVQEVGPIQIIYAGKAHPKDEQAKGMIKQVIDAMNQLKGEIATIYLSDYGMELAKRLTAGVDLWLNNPKRPLEASGTSGMKAALNGIPNLSILDGWWIEGHVEGITGWSIDSEGESGPNDDQEANALYHKLEKLVLPTFYKNRDQWNQIMRQSIATNGSYFSAHRMVKQYLTRAYHL